MIEHDHRTHVPGCFRCELSQDEVDEQREALVVPDPFQPGVPQCPHCRTNYIRKEGPTSARREGKPYWVAGCDCMDKWFQQLLREGKLRAVDVDVDAQQAVDELTAEAQELGMEY